MSKAELQADVFIGPFLSFEQGPGTFAATTSTLVSGPSEAVLIDAQHIRTDVAALAEFIGRTGKKLTTIYVTHGHADHWYGAGDLLETFADARVVATAPVVEYINQSAEVEGQQWTAMFGERVAKPTAVPETLDGLTIELEGHELRIVEVGQGDIQPSTVVHIPDLDAGVAGDVVYNQIHAMLGLSGPSGCKRWIHSLDSHREALCPDDRRRPPTTRVFGLRGESDAGRNAFRTSVILPKEPSASTAPMNWFG